MALLIDCGNGEEPKVILPAKSCLPASCSVKAKVTATNSHLSLIVAADNGAQSTTVGDVVVSLQGSDVNEEVSINVNISLEGEMKVEVIQLSTSQVVGALILSAV